MNRAEHLEWAKQRAIEYAEGGDLAGALASITSDLGKHPDTQGHVGAELMALQIVGGLIRTPEEAIRFIKGFN